MAATWFWLAFGVLHIHFVPAGLFRRVVLTYGDVFHDLPFDSPSKRLFFWRNVVFKLLIALDQALFPGFSYLHLPDILSDFLNVGLIIFFDLLNDGLKFFVFIFELLNVVFFVDGFLDSDFVVFWRLWEEVVVLDDFGSELGLEMLLGLFERGNLLVEVGDLLLWEGELVKGLFGVEFLFINFLEFEKVVGLFLS